MSTGHGHSTVSHPTKICFSWNVSRPRSVLFIMTLLAAILTMGMAVHDTSMFPFFSTLRASEPPSSSTLATAYGFPEDQLCDEVNIFEKGQEAASRPPPSSTLATTYGLSEAQQATYSLPEAQQDDEVNIFSLSEVQQDDEVKVTEKGHEAASMPPSSLTSAISYGLPEAQQAIYSLPEVQQTTFSRSEFQQATYGLFKVQQVDEVNIFGLPEVQQDDETKVTENGHEAASMYPFSSTLTTAYGLPKVQQEDKKKVTEKDHEADFVPPLSLNLATAYSLPKVQQDDETTVTEKG